MEHGGSHGRQKCIMARGEKDNCMRFEKFLQRGVRKARRPVAARDTRDEERRARGDKRQDGSFSDVCSGLSKASAYHFG